MISRLTKASPPMHRLRNTSGKLIIILGLVCLILAMFGVRAYVDSNNQQIDALRYRAVTAEEDARIANERTDQAITPAVEQAARERVEQLGYICDQFDLLVRFAATIAVIGTELEDLSPEAREQLAAFVVVPERPEECP